MAILAILLLVFAFVFAGFGTSSSSTTHSIEPVVKCSKRMPAKAPSARERRCGPPPANP